MKTRVYLKYFVHDFRINSSSTQTEINIPSSGLELPSHKMELRNRVTQNDATLRVTNAKIPIELFFRFNNSTSQNIKLRRISYYLEGYFSAFELLTQRFFLVIFVSFFTNFVISFKTSGNLQETPISGFSL